ncbi:MAG: hypothetical protein JXB14_08455 [Candidatus Altiarchaeota archaeon]|nr:hypothetical protein [Candidatus Altiarchaeota archaeon]
MSALIKLTISTISSGRGGHGQLQYLSLPTPVKNTKITVIKYATMIEIRTLFQENLILLYTNPIESNARATKLIAQIKINMPKGSIVILSTYDN